MCKVTVIIPVFNDEQTIVDCINSVLKNNYPSTEIIIIDDASTDNTSSLLKKFVQGEINVITNLRRLGASGSRNLGISSAAGEYIYFTDADCIVGEDWIKSGLTELKKEGVAGVEGRILYNRTNPEYFYKIPCNPFYHQRISTAINIPNQDFAAANIAFKRQFILQNNGFDAVRYKLGREDTDLGWRMKKNGKINFIPEMTVTHKESIWTIKELLQNSRRYQSDVIFLKDHGFFFFKKSFVLHPQFLLMLVFPPLLFIKYKVRSKQEIKFAFSFYLYLIFSRAHIWRAAVKTRLFVI